MFVGHMVPGSLYRAFSAYEPTSGESSRGRIKHGKEETPVTLKCILAEASTEERERFRQLDRTITHTLIQKRSPIAGIDWIIENPNTHAQYRVKGIDPISELNLFTIYYCEEMDKT